MSKIIDVLFVLSILLLSFLLCFLEKRVSKSSKKKIMLTIAMLIAVFLPLRSIGLDLEGHRYYFGNSGIVALNADFFRNLLRDGMEPTFRILVSFLKKNGLGFEVFLFTYGVIPLYLIYRVISQQEEEMPLTTFFFFMEIHLFRGPIDVIRHFFAAAMYLSALHSLSVPDRKGFWLKSILSFLIHYSNIAVILTYPFLKLKWTFNKYVTALVTVGVMSYVGKMAIFKVADFLIANSSSLFVHRFSYYLYSYNAAGHYQYYGLPHRLMLTFMSYYMVAFNIFLVLAVLQKKEIIKNNNFYRLLLNAQVMGSLIAMSLIILNAETAGLRFQFLFSIGNFFLLKEIIFNGTGVNRQYKFLMATFSLLVFNLVVVLYFAGIHSPGSPLYLF